jgi:hypothetical protein
MTAIQTHDATSSHPHEAAQRGRWLSSSMGHFIRHYIEMVVAMFLGMAVLGAPAGWALGGAGSSWSELNTDAPALMLLGMAGTMTVPMVAWMRYRGHGWRANTEMAASMVLPTLAAIGVLAAGLLSIDTLLVGEHIVMLLGMLAAMLLRLDEYTHHAHGHSEPASA